MRKILRGQLALLVAVIVATGMTGAFIYSINSETSSGSVVKACYDPGSSLLRTVGSVASCGRSESAIDWAQFKSQGSIVLTSVRTTPVRRSHFGPIGP
jgi:thioredoxin reductase